MDEAYSCTLGMVVLKAWCEVDLRFLAEHEKAAFARFLMSIAKLDNKRPRTYMFEEIQEVVYLITIGPDNSIDTCCTRRMRKFPTDAGL